MADTVKYRLKFGCWGYERGYEFEYEPNIAAFQAALDRLVYHPETWDQLTWLASFEGYRDKTWRRSRLENEAGPACGTVGCLAGNIALMAGAKPYRAPESYYDESSAAFDYVLPLHSTDRRSVSEYAAEVLGVPHPVITDSSLFDSANTLVDLWNVAQDLTGDRLIVPPEELIDAAQTTSWRLYGTLREVEENED